MYIVRTASLFVLILALLASAAPQAGAQQETSQPPPPTNRVQSPPVGPIQGPDGLWMMPAGADRAAEGMELAPQSTGGPDEFGYTWDDSVPLNWIDVSGGIETGINSNIDHVGPINIGFPFKYYENTRSQIYISRFGFLAFNDDGIYNSQSRVPSAEKPDDVIAPHWVPGYTLNGYVRYRRGGVAPNRWFVVEWNRLVSDCCDDPPEEYTFEAILRESGDIVFQYGNMSLSGGWMCQASGIEDAAGLDGLAITRFCENIRENHAVQISRPAPSARVGLSSLFQGKFTSPGEKSVFQIPIRNTGDLGADTFDLTVSSPWPASLFASDGVTPLMDTDGDGMVDTGALAQGQSRTVFVEIRTPGGASVGQRNAADIQIRSSRDVAKKKTVSLVTSVPTNFLQAFQDGVGSAMRLSLQRPEAQAERQVFASSYGHYSPSIAEMHDHNVVYAWRTGRCLDSICSRYGYEIEYAILDPYGEVVREASKLTDYSGATLDTYDYDPVMAVAPDGRIGVLWRQHRYNQSNDNYNENIYFAVLGSGGAILVAPTNLTNNGVWGSYSDIGVPGFYNPRISAAGDNPFFIAAWSRSEYGPPSGNCTSYCAIEDIWYTVRDSNGVMVQGVSKLTNDSPGYEDGYRYPALATLAGDKTLLAWTRSGVHGDIYYVILNSWGSVVRGSQPLSTDSSADWGADAVALDDGRIVVAWNGTVPQNQGEHGWTASFFNNENLSGTPVLVRTDPTINFNWFGDPPGPGVNPDHFSVRWQSTITLAAGKYEITMGSDDGSRLWIDGQLVYDRWNDCCQYWNKSVDLSAGPHIFKMEMREIDGWSWAYLVWRRTPNQVIRYAVMDSNYNLIVGPTALDNPAARTGDGYVSVTKDQANRAILTWMDYDYSSRQNLYYALLRSNGTVQTQPMIFRSSQASQPYLVSSFEGSGSTSYSWTPPAGVDNRLTLEQSAYSGAVHGDAVIDIHYSGRGGQKATGVVLTATLDPRLAYRSDTTGVTPTVNGNMVTWNLPDVRLFDQHEFILQLQVTSGALGDQIPVHLALTSTQPDLNPDDNVASVAVRVDRPLYLPLALRQ